MSAGEDEDERIECPVCGCLVIEDEFFECPSCNKPMCLYCFQEESCPEHAIPYGDPHWQEEARHA